MVIEVILQNHHDLLQDREIQEVQEIIEDLEILPGQEKIEETRKSLLLFMLED